MSRLSGPFCCRLEHSLLFFQRFLNVVQSLIKMGHHASKLQKLKRGSVRSSEYRHIREFSKYNSLDANAVIDTDEFEQVSLLWFAVRHNDVELAKLLLAAGARVNQASGNLHMTPLHMASYSLNKEMITLLLSNGAFTNVLDRWNYSPIMYVAVNYEPNAVAELFALLIDAGCDVNFGATLSGDCAEAIFQEVGEREVLKSFTESVTYVKEPLGAVSGTALHLVAQNPHLPDDCIELLLQANADVNLRNLHGQVPLMVAILDTYYDYHPNVKSHAVLLLDEGTDVNQTDNRGWNCFHYAAQRGNTTCMELLFKRGCDCNALSHDKVSPLWLLLIDGWLEAARFLICNGCDLDTSLLSTTILSINSNADVCRYGPMLPLEFALCNKYYSLASLMLRADCELAHAVIVEDDNDSRQRDFRRCLHEMKQSKMCVARLKNICRSVIRNSIQCGIVFKCRTLGLPPALCDFVGLLD